MNILIVLLLLGSWSGNVLAEGDIEAGKQKAAMCNMCHRPGGKGPLLADWPASEIVSIMNNLKQGQGSATMVGQAKRLSDADIANLAAYYSSLETE